MSEMCKNNGEVSNVLVFLGYMDAPLLALKYIKRILANTTTKNYTVISMNHFMDEFREATGLEITYFADVLEKEDYEYMQDYANRVSENWYRHINLKNEEIGLRGTEIMKVLTLDMYIFVSTAVRNLHIILNIIASKKIDAVVLVSENKEDQLDAIAFCIRSSLGIKTHFMRVRRNSPKAFLLSMSKKIEQLVIDRITRLLDRVELIYLKHQRAYRGSILIDYKYAHIINGIGS